MTHPVDMGCDPSCGHYSINPNLFLLSTSEGLAALVLQQKLKRTLRFSTPVELKVLKSTHVRLKTPSTRWRTLTSDQPVTSSSAVADTSHCKSQAGPERTTVSDPPANQTFLIELTSLVHPVKITDPSDLI